MTPPQGRAFESDRNEDADLQSARACAPYFVKRPGDEPQAAVTHRVPTRKVAAGDERALVARLRRGDQQAFEELVRRHADRLYAVLLRFSASAEDAEEASQEALVRAWRSIGRFRGQSRFFTWVYRIGVNEAHRIAERRPPAGKVVSVEQRPVDDLGDEAPSPQHRVEQKELRASLEAAIARLPERYRPPIVLRDIEELSTTEAAEALGMSTAGFKSRLHRARLALRRQLDEKLSDGVV